MAKHIEFNETTATGKTKRWWVQAIGGGVFLGEIKFRPQWRKYCFFPSGSCLFEEDCLRDIADFIQQQTASWRLALNTTKTRGDER